MKGVGRDMEEEGKGKGSEGGMEAQPQIFSNTPSLIFLELSLPATSLGIVELRHKFFCDASARES